MERHVSRGDLASDLLDAQVDGRRLDDAELVSFMFLLLVAGFETTTHLLTNSLRLLAAHPDLLARLRRDPTAIVPHDPGRDELPHPVRAALNATRAVTRSGGIGLRSALPSAAS
ncbi:cytochrome P450 [Polyangium fumosum]|uniref:cytochrome P450 n=1 Tax=Polyangium fumosum TaxID=889272 RepID=UPI001E47BF61|nr:cytochrome P450 [Polyangium fumosum]